MSKRKHHLRRYGFYAVPLLLAAFLLNGCLTAEKKVYEFSVNPDGTGRGTITFYNLMSQDEDSTDVSLEDYGELVARYVKGKKFEEENENYRVVSKRLFEKDGELCGEVTFEFDSYTDVGLFRYENKGPWMYYTDPNAFGSEKFVESDGTYGGEKMPVVFWPEGTTSFRIVSDLVEPGPDTHSLLPLYRKLGAE